VKEVRSDMMSLSRAILGISVLVLAEALYTGAEAGSWPVEGGERKLTRLSFGFPFRSIEWTTAGLDDVLYEGHPERDKWDAGVKMRPPLVVCDLLVAVLVAVLLVTLVPVTVLAWLAQAAAVGLTVGALVSYLDAISPRIWPPLVVLVTGLFLVGPAVTYGLSKRAHHPVLTAILSTLVMLVAFLRGGMMMEGVTIEAELVEWVRVLVLLAVAAVVIAGECLLVRLLDRKVLPILARGRGADDARMEQSPLHLQSRHPPGSDGMKLNRRWILVCVGLLLATLYVGHHFVMVEVLEAGAFSDQDRDAVNRLVFSEFMASAVAAGDGMSGVTITGITESFDGGLKAVYRLRAVVNREDMYDITVTKNILIPWYQLEKEAVDAEPASR
jgi:hypothetical protein